MSRVAGLFLKQVHQSVGVELNMWFISRTQLLTAQRQQVSHIWTIGWELMSRPLCVWVCPVCVRREHLLCDTPVRLGSGLSCVCPPPGAVGGRVNPKEELLISAPLVLVVLLLHRPVFWRKCYVFFPFRHKREKCLSVLLHSSVRSVFLSHIEAEIIFSLKASWTVQATIFFFKPNQFLYVVYVDGGPLADRI